MTGLAMPAPVGAMIRHANTGGPSSRTRREAINATLLGDGQQTINCPRIVRLGIVCPAGDPVELVTGILNEEGYAAPEDLRGELAIPAGRLVARPHARDDGVVDLLRDARRDILWHALMLGLCTAQFYDPARPVLWTRAALQRRLELFDPAGFYA